MPEDVARSFSETQLDTIERALDAARWQTHPVDIRLSVPLFWRRLYLVLLVGPERRSRDRRAVERARRPLRTVANVIVLAALSVLAVPMVVGLVYLASRSWSG